MVFTHYVTPPRVFLLVIELFQYSAVRDQMLHVAVRRRYVADEEHKQRPSKALARLSMQAGMEWSDVIASLFVRTDTVTVAHSAFRLQARLRH